ncbi:MAG: NAD regulator [Vicinamibacterales bacterium]
MPAPPSIVVGLNAAIVAVTDDEPRLITIEGSSRVPATGGREAPALPFGPLDPAGHRTLELGLRTWVREQTGLELGYVEQLYTFADRNRDPGERAGGPRVVSIAYLALVREGRVAAGTGARWRGFYEFLPWEDGRRGRPALVESVIAPALGRWMKAAPDAEARRARRERADITFGLHGAAFDSVRVLERYELLYEAGLVSDAARDAGLSRRPAVEVGEAMALDHRRLMATALGRLRGKLKYRPVVFELLPATFTLLKLQRVVEALAGAPLHKQNFRRLVETGRLVEGTGVRESRSKGRPAELFRFRREVLRERRAPGLSARS